MSDELTILGIIIIIGSIVLAPFTCFISLLGIIPGIILIVWDQNEHNTRLIIVQQHQQPQQVYTQPQHPQQPVSPAQQTKYCIYCGKPNPVDAHFCAYCGK